MADTAGSRRPSGTQGGPRATRGAADGAAAADAAGRAPPCAGVRACASRVRAGNLSHLLGPPLRAVRVRTKGLLRGCSPPLRRCPAVPLSRCTAVYRCAPRVCRCSPLHAAFCALAAAALTSPRPGPHTDSAFKQQRLKAWQPILTPKWGERRPPSPCVQSPGTACRPLVAAGGFRPTAGEALDSRSSPPLRELLQWRRRRRCVRHLVLHNTDACFTRAARLLCPSDRFVHDDWRCVHRDCRRRVVGIRGGTLPPLDPCRPPLSGDPLPPPLRVNLPALPRARDGCAAPLTALRPARFCKHQSSTMTSARTSC